MLFGQFSSTYFATLNIKCLWPKMKEMGEKMGGPHERAKEDGVQLGHQIKDRKKKCIKSKGRAGWEGPKRVAKDTL